MQTWGTVVWFNLTVKVRVKYTIFTQMELLPRGSNNFWPLTKELSVLLWTLKRRLTKLLERNYGRYYPGIMWESNNHDIRTGVKQGCAISAWLFNLYLDSCLQGVKQSDMRVKLGDLNVNCLLYVDDAVLIASSEC